MPTTTVMIASMLGALHASSTSDLVFWTGTGADNELVTWLDEAAKRLGNMANVFVRRDTSITTVGGTRAYTLPARTVNVIHAAFNGVPLRPASTLELNAKDDYYLQTRSTPTHWYTDREGLGTVALYPVPETAAGVALIQSEVPADLTDGATLDVNTLLSDYCEVYALQRSYEKESDAAMPEVAAHLVELMKLYEGVFTEYYE